MPKDIEYRRLLVFKFSWKRALVRQKYYKILFEEWDKDPFLPVERFDEISALEFDNDAYDIKYFIVQSLETEEDRKS